MLSNNLLLLLTNFYYLLKIGSDILLMNDFIFPHATLYQDENGQSASLLVDCGSGSYYFINEIENDQPGMLLLRLISLYYVFDTRFPPCFGILSLFDSYCVTKAYKMTTFPRESEDHSEPGKGNETAKKKLGGKKRSGKSKSAKSNDKFESASLVQFRSKFNVFLSSNV